MDKSTEIRKAEQRRDEIVQRRRALLQKAEEFASRAEENVRAHEAARAAGVAGDEAELRKAKKLLVDAEDCRAFAAFHREEAARLDEKIAECGREIERLRVRQIRDACLIRVLEAEKKTQEAVAKLAEFLALAKQCEQQYGQIAGDLRQIDRERLWSRAQEISGLGERMFFVVCIRELERAFPGEPKLGRLASELRPLELESKLGDLVHSAFGAVIIP